MAADLYAAVNIVGPDGRAVSAGGVIDQSLYSPEELDHLVASGGAESKAKSDARMKALREQQAKDAEEQE